MSASAVGRLKDAIALLEEALIHVSDLNAALENVLLHQGEKMTKADRVSRTRVCEEARRFLGSTDGIEFDVSPDVVTLDRAVNCAVDLLFREAGPELPTGYSVELTICDGHLELRALDPDGEDLQFDSDGSAWLSAVSAAQQHAAERGRREN